jgi:Trk-type K+ transport system membrane component
MNDLVSLRDVLISACSFLTGVGVGWLLRSSMESGKINFDKVFQAIIFMLITLAWSGATLRSVFYDGEATPLILNMFFGAVVGSTAKGFKETLLEIISAFYNRNEKTPKN